MDKPSTSSGHTATASSSPAPEVTKLSIEKTIVTEDKFGYKTINITYRTPPVSAYEVFKAYERNHEINVIKRINAKEYMVQLEPKCNVDQIGTIPLKIDETTMKEVDRNGTEKKHELNSALPSQHSPLNIVNALNDDCLMDIFERLSKDHLYTLAFVCKRFRSIAVRILQTKHKDEPFNFNYLKYLGRLPIPSLSLFVNCLRIFGPTSVHLPHQYNMDITLQAMNEYCPNLKELDLSGVSNIDPHTTAALRSLLPKLRRLTIVATDILDRFADVDWELEKLHVFKVTFLPDIKTPRLKELCIGYDELNEPLVFAFLANNSQLTALEFICCKFKWDQWCTLAECVPNIEKLTLTNCGIEGNVDHQIQIAGIFQRLTVCEMTSVHRWDSFLKLLVGATLDCFKLDDYYVRNSISIDAICRLTTINKLSIHQAAVPMYGIDDEYLLRITRSLSGLRELSIKRCRLTLRTLRTILRESQAITRCIVDIEPDGNLNFELAVLNDISAMIAARPELHIAITVYQTRLRTTSEDLLPYANWLKASP